MHFVAPLPSLLLGDVSVSVFASPYSYFRLLIIFADYKFDLMYSKRAFVHWYVGEGMEEVRPFTLFRLHTLTLIYCDLRVSSLRPVKILQHSKRITKRLVLTPLTLKKRASIRESETWTCLCLCVRKERSRNT